jgi:hypothetical protein
MVFYAMLNELSPPAPKPLWHNIENFRVLLGNESHTASSAGVTDEAQSVPSVWRQFPIYVHQIQPFLTRVYTLLDVSRSSSLSPVAVIVGCQVWIVTPSHLKCAIK